MHSLIFVCLDQCILMNVTAFPVDAAQRAASAAEFPASGLLTAVNEVQWCQRFQCCLCVTLAGPYVTDSPHLALGALIVISEPLMLT